MRILIADDDRNLRKVLVNELSSEGFSVDEADSGSRAKDLLQKEEYDVLLLDLNMPGMSGMDILRYIRDSEMTAEVIIFTGHATVSTAVDAMKMGAYDYIAKPFRIDELLTVIGKAYEKRKLLRENLALKSQLQRHSETKDIITQSPLMIDVLESIRKFAVSDLPVLIYGESGVGKELVAHALHNASGRAEGPFIPINCSAIPETMLESELFGHEKGAFTGAHAKKLGLLEIASHGSLFLDEIGELNPQLQGKLLRVIETGRFFRVGGVKEVNVDVRFVSATNKDIPAEMKANNFRPDLYYRISAFTVRVPPLRERKEDIPLIIEHIIHSNASFRNKKFSKNALETLSGYPWPGNVRELQNIVHRALFLSKEHEIDMCYLPADLAADHKSSGKRLEDIEREHILGVFNEVQGHKKKAADILGIDPKTLNRKLSSYGITITE
jgi:DNA-binding NtrC family response regulator